MVNILSSVGIIKKISKGVYQWQGTEESVKIMENIPTVQKAMKIFWEEKSLISLTSLFLAYVFTKKTSDLEEII